jgi:transmembrane sensor
MRNTTPMPEGDLWSDGALRDALQASAATGRLSDEDVRKLRANRKRGVASVTAVAFAGLLGVGSWHAWPRQEAPTPVLHFATAPGEMREVELADGSSVQLSGGTRVEIALGPDRREASLSAGEAFFDVAHDPVRPFSVRAGATRVRVLGTAFDLGRSGDQVGLAVYRGAVSFAAGTGRTVVQAGYRARYRGGRTDPLIRFDPTQPDWRLGWLDTDGMKLADLVGVLNRQTGAIVEPPPPGLANIAVSGRFRLDDSEQLLTAIGSVDGFAVRHSGKTLRIIAQP